MKDKKDKKDLSKEVEKIDEVSKKLKPDIFSQVKNLNDINNVVDATKDKIKKEIDDNKTNQESVKLEVDAAKQLSLSLFKNVVKTLYPEKYAAFANLSWDDYYNQLQKSPTFANLLDNTNSETTTVEVFSNGASVAISPNMFWKNATTILNDVSVGRNGLDLSTVFNAFDFYNDGWLTSGISKLYTAEYTAVGVIMLNQNMLIPQNYTVNGSVVQGATQNIAGYQASHPVFANVPYDEAGSGIGWGLFARANTTMNVWKLSVTSPEQYAKMNLQFLELMENSKATAIWAISTNNLFSNITNLVLDNINTNMRDCFNYSLFPNLVQMSTIQQMYNLGDSVTVTTNGTAATFNYGVTTDAQLDAATSAVRSGTLSSNYLIQGYNTNVRPNSCKMSDIHLVVTPNTYVKMFSGMLSVLYNYGFQSWDFYVKKENIHLIYKKPSIDTSYLNPTEGLSAHLIPVTFEQEWFSDENILVLTKPDDVNYWPATYGYVWNDLQDQYFAAAQIKTEYLHFLIYGGVTPYAQAFWYHAKGITNPLATSPSPKTQNIVYNKNVAVNFENN